MNECALVKRLNQRSRGALDQAVSGFTWLRGHRPSAPGAEELVNTNPISVSGDNYTMTVTTSMADGNTIYFTLLVEAKTARVSVRLSGVEEDLWLTFPVEPIHTATLEINAEGQGMCYWLGSGSAGPVTRHSPSGV